MYYVKIYSFWRSCFRKSCGFQNVQLAGNFFPQLCICKCCIKYIILAGCSVPCQKQRWLHGWTYSGTGQMVELCILFKYFRHFIVSNNGLKIAFKNRFYNMCNVWGKVHFWRFFALKFHHMSISTICPPVYYWIHNLYHLQNSYYKCSECCKFRKMFLVVSQLANG